MYENLREEPEVAMFELEAMVPKYHLKQFRVFRFFSFEHQFVHYHSQSLVWAVCQKALGLE